MCVSAATSPICLEILRCYNFRNRVPDPDPSNNKQKLRKILIFTVCDVTLNDLLSLKYANAQKIIFVGILGATKVQDPNPDL